MQGDNTEEKVSTPPTSKVSSPTTEALETAILKVFLNSGSCVIVKFAVDTLVKVITFICWYKSTYVHVFYELTLL